MMAPMMTMTMEYVLFNLSVDQNNRRDRRFKNIIFQVMLTFGHGALTVYQLLPERHLIRQWSERTMREV
jgi:hypothetical protein